jgi:hypothetical protein
MASHALLRDAGWNWEHRRPGSSWCALCARPEPDNHPHDGIRSEIQPESPVQLCRRSDLHARFKLLHVRAQVRELWNQCMGPDIGLLRSNWRSAAQFRSSIAGFHALSRGAITKLVLLSAGAYVGGIVTDSQLIPVLPFRGYLNLQSVKTWRATMARIPPAVAVAPAIRMEDAWERINPIALRVSMRSSWLLRHSRFRVIKPMITTATGSMISKTHKPRCGRDANQSTMRCAVCAGSYCNGWMLRANNANMKRTDGETNSSSKAARGRRIVFMDSLCITK